MGWIQRAAVRKRERHLAERVARYVPDLAPHEIPIDSQAALILAYGDWVEGVLVLTSDRTVFGAHTGPRPSFSADMPHEAISNIRLIGPSPFTAGLTRLYRVEDQDSFLEVDVSDSFLSVWLAAIDADRVGQVVKDPNLFIREAMARPRFPEG